MKVFTYNTLQNEKVPFDEFHDDLGLKKEFIISNHDQYLENFERYKKRLMILVGDVTEDKVFCVPHEVSEKFMNWLREKYQDIQWNKKEIPSRNPQYTPVHGADDLNGFIQRMKVEEEWESCEVKPYEPEKEVIPDENNQNYFLNLDLRTTVIMIVVVFSVGFLIGFLISFAFLCEDFSGCNNKGDKVLLEQEYGQLTITTALPDSDIYINDKKQDQKTPVLKMKVLAGKNIQIKIVSISDIEKCATIDLSPDESKSLGDSHFQTCN